MELKKNPIIRPHSAQNEIYISRKKPLKIYMARVEKLIDLNYLEIIVHGSGAAIPTAISLANKVSNLFKSKIIKTSSVSVVDDLSSSKKIRTIPAIHICLKLT